MIGIEWSETTEELCREDFKEGTTDEQIHEYLLKAFRDEEARVSYGLKESFLQDIVSDVACLLVRYRWDGLDEGRISGRYEGEKKGRAEILSLLQSGKSPAEILALYAPQ
jgi:hypothetical protein